MKLEKLFIATLLAAFTLNSFAEKIYRGNEASQKIENAELVRYKDGFELPNFIRFTQGQGPDVSQISSWILSNFGVAGEFDLVASKTEEDQYGFTHIRLDQYFAGVKVEYASLIAHIKDGKVHSINGYALKDVPQTQFSMDELAGLNSALNFVNARTYKWELADEEMLLKMETGNPEATYYPAGKKVFLPNDADFSSEEVMACWKFDIYANEPLYRANVYVNAETGAVVFEDMTLKHVDTASTAKTSYSGIRNIVSDFVSQGQFRLRESSRGGGVETYDMLNGTSHGSAVDITNDSTYWPDTLRIEYATDAHWGSEMVYDYYLGIHNFNSFDGNGATMRSYVHYGNNYANAFWDGQRMTYGDGNSNISALTTLDIAGHEITHGVDQYTSNLIYRNESGALDESFADIFGNCVEYHNKPNPVNNWLVGEEIGFNLRSMSNPKARQDPDTYGGVHYYTGTADNGGVHTNSGVQNHWFYLLSVGGSGTNDNGDAYNVTGITINKAELIAHRNRAVYLTSSSDYEDARFFSTESAIDIYGPCSAELASTVNAWYAVGVGDAYSASVESDFVAFSPENCKIPAEVSFRNLSNYNAITYVWDFGDGDTSSQRNPVHTYNKAGTYTVKLTATGTATCGSDVETKNAYVIIDPPADVQVSPYDICDGWPAKLTANANDTVFWFTDTLTDVPVFVGQPFITAPLFADTTFYAANAVPAIQQTVGPADNTIGTGGNFNGDRYLVFDVLEEMTLEEVTVYSFDTKARLIELRDGQGNVLQSKLVTPGTGEQTLQLNFKISPGTDYQLGVNQVLGVDFYRNSSGASYPYEIGGLVSIKNPGTAPMSYYYFFYDWKVKGPDCIGRKKAVDVTVDFDPNCVPYVGLEEEAGISEWTVFPNPNNGNFNIELNASVKSNASIRLIDARGAVVYSNLNAQIEGGRNLISVETSNLAKGVYLLQFESVGTLRSERLIIE